jgi:hypothetical protein
MRPTFCPECNEPLGRPGATPLRCPVCSTALAPDGVAVTDAPPSLVVKEWKREPKRPPVQPAVRALQPLGRAWRVVHFGLGLIKWGAAAALAALAFNLLVVLAAPSHGPAAHGAPPPEDHLGLLAVIILSALSALLSLLGRLCCCSVPPATAARLPAVLAFFATLLAQAIGGLIVLSIVLVATEAASPVWLVPAVLAAGSAGLLAEALFLVFLYQAGRSLQEPAVGRRVLYLVIGTAVIVVGVAFAVLFLATSDVPFLPARAPAGSLTPGQPPGTSPLANRALLSWLAILFGAALVLLQYFDLINVSRHALGRRLARDAAAIQAQPG